MDPLIIIYLNFEFKTIKDNKNNAYINMNTNNNHNDTVENPHIIISSHLSLKFNPSNFDMQNPVTLIPWKL